MNNKQRHQAWVFHRRCLIGYVWAHIALGAINAVLFYDTNEIRHFGMGLLFLAFAWLYASLLEVHQRREPPKH